MFVGPEWAYACWTPAGTVAPRSRALLRKATASPLPLNVGLRASPLPSVLLTTFCAVQHWNGVAWIPSVIVIGAMAAATHTTLKGVLTSDLSCDANATSTHGKPNGSPVQRDPIPGRTSMSGSNESDGPGCAQSEFGQDTCCVVWLATVRSRTPLAPRLFARVSNATSGPPAESAIAGLCE